jgi:EpsI family protein
MIDRRSLILGGSCAAAALAATALVPRTRLSLLGATPLDDIIPAEFGPWKKRPDSHVLVPETENSLSAKLYSQTVTRQYVDNDAGRMMMLLIAYGDTQSDTLQLHRPETCYPAFGFQLSNNHATHIALAGGGDLPSRSLTASVPERVEHITYWTRIGEFLPTSTAEQRRMKLRTALEGVIPDGILVRLSTIGQDSDTSFAALEEFGRALIMAVTPDHRAALVGNTLARALPAA